jgi:hypothetical protein
MIEIKQSREADTRSATGKVSREVLLENSEQHITDVMKAMAWMGNRLFDVDRIHDWTKIENIVEFYADFSATQDGFQGDFKQMHWFKDLHLQERHHLKDYCPDDVTLFDCLERIADIVTAGMARSGHVFDEDIDPDILSRAYSNTIKLLKEQITIIGNGDTGELNENSSDRV